MVVDPPGSSAVALPSAEGAEAVALPSAKVAEEPLVDVVLPSAAVEDGKAVFPSGAKEASCSFSAAQSSTRSRGDGSSGSASSWLWLVPKSWSKAAALAILRLVAAQGRPMHPVWLHEPSGCGREVLASSDEGVRPIGALERSGWGASAGNSSSSCVPGGSSLCTHPLPWHRDSCVPCIGWPKGRGSTDPGEPASSYSCSGRRVQAVPQGEWLTGQREHCWEICACSQRWGWLSCRPRR